MSNSVRCVPYALLLTFAAATRPAVARAPAGEEFSGQLILRFRPSRVLQSTAHAALPIERELGEDMVLVRAADLSPARRADLTARLAADPDVLWIEREHLRRRHSGASPNDPLLSAQWSLALARIPLAWQHGRGLGNVVVAVVDTGSMPHPDLADRYLPGYDFITNPTTAGDGDGRDPDAHDEGVAEPGSSGLHGLHVAGIIGAQTDNGQGIAGIDWRCRLLPVRVLGVSGGTGTDSDIADGIRWAAGAPVKGAPANPTPASVINLSFGGPGISAVLQAAVDAAVARGAVVIASAGNDAADTATYAPAGLNHVIAVGAVDRRGVLTDYSNRGPRLDLVAPGGGPLDPTPAGILSTFVAPAQPTPTWDYVTLFGTSQAAPHVSAVAALMRGSAPELTGEQIGRLLRDAADPAGQCAAGCGRGLLDAAAAVAVATQAAGCDNSCSADEACQRGRCLRIFGEPASLIAGCRAAPTRSGATSTAATLLLALPLLVFVVQQRRRVDLRRSLRL